MRVLLTILTFIFFTASAFAQAGGKVTGTITSAEEKTELPAGITVSLHRAKDSATVKFILAGKDGSYTFENLANGKYLVSASSVGFRKRFSAPFELTAAQPAAIVAPLAMMPLPKALTGVTVTASRPLVEQKIDRTVVNVDASITNVGTSALEVLEKSPGISVDRDGNISLKGKEGVLIMVDGRPTQLSGQDLANLLRNMNSSQLDQIEIMTNPPARYDAAGNAGIINIKTKKIITSGLNGTASVGFTQGRYPKTNEGLNLNYRKGKVNVFTNLSHGYNKNLGTLKFNRNILENDNTTIRNIFDQRTDRLSTGQFYNAKLGLDFFATKKTTVGVVLGGSIRNQDGTSDNTTRISNNLKNLQSITLATVLEENNWNSFTSNLYFRRVLNKAGRELTADADYLRYGSGNDQFMVNAFTDAAGNPNKKSDTLLGNLPQNISVYSGRVDYIHPLKKGARFEAGIKSGIVNTDNDARYDSIIYGRTVADFNRSNHFQYEENINAAYVNLSTPLTKKINAQLGLRMENTNAKGRQLTTGDNFDRQYIQLFPTAYFQYKANENNNFGANFGRRVRRPSYQSLNPFIYFLDQYTARKGNPNLKPSLSNNAELTHTWKNKITTTLNYTVTSDMIETIIEQIGDTAYNTPANIASLKQFGISVNANTPITKWWTSVLNINAFNNHYKGVVSNAPVNLSTTSFILNVTQQFKITKTLSGEINGRWRNGWLEGVLKAKPVGFVGAGLSQQVLKNQGTLRLSARDIFFTQRFRGRADYGNVDFNIEQYGESRVVSLGFSYRFSKGKKIAPVKRTQGSATEEQERIGQ
jgi:outer membrane receptor protein involved in Fe transport